ncbi:MAG: dienelactone hydrolase family protein [Waddliaceae bacterium]
MKKILISLVLLFSGLSSANAEIIGKEVTYSANGTTLNGYVAFDDSIEGKRPGVIVVHEWWGHNEYARKRADMLAELGYIALAVDMYGDGKTADHPDSAAAFMNEAFSNMALFQKKFEAGLELLKSQERAVPEHIAAIGYCFGGKTVLEMARAGVDLDGVASFHGLLATNNPAQKGKVKASVIAFHGADDPFVKPEDVEAFKKEMAGAEVDFKFVQFEGVKHSFTNPVSTELGKKFGLPHEYNEEADNKSWEGLKAFLERVFSK